VSPEPRGDVSDDPNAIPTFLVNLPARSDRRELALSRCDAAGIKPEVFPAVTPDEVTKAGLTWVPWLPPGAAACALSHKLVLEEIVDRNLESALVLEDDVVFRDDFTARMTALCNELGAGWDFVQLGWLRMPGGVPRGSRAWRALEKLKPAIARLRASHLESGKGGELALEVAPGWGTHCYLISARLAREISGLLTGPFFAPIDYFYRYYYESKSTYVGREARFWKAKQSLADQDLALGSDVDSTSLAYRASG
jgi:GR25 family glycosyltransferase involved in LPS biosynthesis